MGEGRRTADDSRPFHSSIRLRWSVLEPSRWSCWADITGDERWGLRICGAEREEKCLGWRCEWNLALPRDVPFLAPGGWHKGHVIRAHVIMAWHNSGPGIRSDMVLKCFDSQYLSSWVQICPFSFAILEYQGICERQKRTTSNLLKIVLVVSSPGLGKLRETA
jgi:hypothetical protein